ncbi:hypothetical protein CR513_21531, partial [Mucuna pruriens]
EAIQAQLPALEENHTLDIVPSLPTIKSIGETIGLIMKKCLLLQLNDKELKLLLSFQLLNVGLCIKWM